MSASIIIISTVLTVPYISMLEIRKHMNITSKCLESPCFVNFSHTLSFCSMLSGLPTCTQYMLHVDTRCPLPDGSFLVLDGVRYILLPSTGNTTQAANIILLVDESGSMIMQHSWIPEMIKQLDNALVNVGIGVDPRNNFGVIGFGDDCTTEATANQAFLTNESVTYVPADRIAELTQGLQTGGKYEDGYRAIASAFEQYTFGDRTSLFILISDEDRDAISNITRGEIESMLAANEVVLNVVVSEEFTADGAQAFGIDAEGTAFVYDPSSDVLFRNIDNFGVPVNDSGHGSTNADYTQLALQAKGGSWNIGLLSQGRLRSYRARNHMHRTCTHIEAVSGRLSPKAWTLIWAGAVSIFIHS